MSYRDYVKLERIPTASVLLRVDYTAIDYEGNFISFKDPDPQIRALAYEPPPNYNAGSYSTLYYIISEVERDVYAIRRQRKIDVPLVEASRELARAMNSDAESDAELVKFFRSRFHNMPMNPFDHNFFSVYEPKVGFSFDLEVFYGQPTKDSTFMVMASLIPPGNPYQKPPKTEKAFTISKIDYEKSFPSLVRFDED